MSELNPRGPLPRCLRFTSPVARRRCKTRYRPARYGVGRAGFAPAGFHSEVSRAHAVPPLPRFRGAMCEISKSLWEPLFGFHRDEISIAVFGIEGESDCGSIAPRREETGSVRTRALRRGHRLPHHRVGGRRDSHAATSRIPTPRGLRTFDV